MVIYFGIDVLSLGFFDLKIMFIEVEDLRRNKQKKENRLEVGWDLEVNLTNYFFQSLFLEGCNFLRFLGEMYFCNCL